jgi:DNA invertase Pin-like site-specific DNA recombinase
MSLEQGLTLRSNGLSCVQIGAIQMQYIYTRVSTDRQETENQTHGLRESYPNAAIVEEIASGAKCRPKLQELLERLVKGDVLIVYALDRLGRRTSEVLALIEDLERRGVVLKSMREGVDYSTIAGRLVTQILCSVAEMERNLISERTKLALAARKKQGVQLGAKAKYDSETVARVRALKAEGLTVREIAIQVGMSASRVSQLTKVRVTEDTLSN